MPALGCTRNIGSPTQEGSEPGMRQNKRQPSETFLNSHTHTIHIHNIHTTHTYTYTTHYIDITYTHIPHTHHTHTHKKTAKNL